MRFLSSETESATIIILGKKYLDFFSTFVRIVSVCYLFFYFLNGVVGRMCGLVRGSSALLF
jgi:hypothetical protein